MNQLPKFHETNFTAITGTDGAPWVSSADLTAALGYTDRSAVTRIYQRNAAEFTPAMTELIRLSRGQIDRKSQGETRIFSLRGAHLVAMFAKTPRAATFRCWVLDVLEGMALARPDRQVERLTLWLAGRPHCTVGEAAAAMGLALDKPGRTHAAALLRLLGWQRGFIAPTTLALPAPARGGGA